MTKTATLLAKLRGGISAFPGAGRATTRTTKL